MNVSDTELSNIATHEGIRYAPYYDQRGYSIADGHFTGVADEGDYSAFDADMQAHGITPDANRNITYADILTLLRGDVATVVNDEINWLTVSLTQGQFDALVDFGYGAGVGAMKQAITFVNAENLQGAASLIQSWVHDSNGNVIANLVPLRNATAAALLNTTPTTSEAGFGLIAGIIIGGLALNELYKYAKEKGYVR